MVSPISPSPGRHVAITGAGSGIGRAVALRLASAGARLSIYGRRAEALEETALLCGRAGAEAVHLCRCDVRDRGQVDASFDGAAEVLGPVHALVANAGVGGPNAPGSTDHPGGEDRFEDLIATNLTGAYFTLRAAERNLAPGPARRDLLVISSILARFGVPGHTGYCASKAGVLGLVRALAMELAGGNVQVNAICPGWVDTAMATAGLRRRAEAEGISEPEARALAVDEVPLRRMSEPGEIAETAFWLLSPGARGITGQGIDVNNGAWMG